MEGNFSDETKKKRNWKKILLKLKVWAKFLPILLILGSILIYISYNIGKSYLKDFENIGIPTKYEEITYIGGGITIITIVVLVIIQIIITLYDIYRGIKNKSFGCNVKEMLNEMKEMLNKIKELIKKKEP